MYKDHVLSYLSGSLTRGFILLIGGSSSDVTFSTTLSSGRMSSQTRDSTGQKGEAYVERLF